MTKPFDTLASRVDLMGFRSVGFSSALLGEGVTTITLGTALSLAALRQDPVLLIDANWIQPSLSADAHLESAPGLAEYLAGKADLATLIRPSSRAGLSLLPIGDRAAARPTVRRLTALLGSDVVRSQRVVVDLPPILTGESFVMAWAPLLEQLFFVLREAATPLPLAREALSRFGPAATDIVLNRGGAPRAGSAELRPARA